MNLRRVYRSAPLPVLAVSALGTVATALRSPLYPRALGALFVAGILGYGVRPRRLAVAGGLLAGAYALGSFASDALLGAPPDLLDGLAMVATGMVGVFVGLRSGKSKRLLRRIPAVAIAGGLTILAGGGLWFSGAAIAVTCAVPGYAADLFGRPAAGLADACLRREAIAACAPERCAALAQGKDACEQAARDCPDKKAATLSGFLDRHGTLVPDYAGVALLRRELVDGGVAERYACPNRDASFRILRTALVPGGDPLGDAQRAARAGGQRARMEDVAGHRAVIVEYPSGEFRSLLFGSGSQLIAVESGCSFDSDTALAIAASLRRR